MSNWYIKPEKLKVRVTRMRYQHDKDEKNSVKIWQHMRPRQINNPVHDPKPLTTEELVKNKYDRFDEGFRVVVKKRLYADDFPKPLTPRQLASIKLEQARERHKKH